MRLSTVQNSIKATLRKQTRELTIGELRAQIKALERENALLKKQLSEQNNPS